MTVCQISSNVGDDDDGDDDDDGSDSCTSD